MRHAATDRSSLHHDQMRIRGILNMGSTMLNRIKLIRSSQLIASVCLSAALAMLTPLISAVEAGPLAPTPSIIARDSGAPLIKIAQCTQAQIDACNGYVKQCNRNAILRAAGRMGLPVDQRYLDSYDFFADTITAGQDKATEVCKNMRLREKSPLPNPPNWDNHYRFCWQAFQGCAIHYNKCLKTCRW